MNKVQSDLTELESAFVDSAGELAGSLALARSVGQIYALLYLAPEPLTLDEVCRKLAISKGNASMNLRTLEDWEAVERAWVRGSRSARYRARLDLRRIALKRVEEGVKRRLALVKDRLARLESRPGHDKRVDKRIAEFKQFLGSVEKAAALLPKLESLSRLV